MRIAQRLELSREGFDIISNIRHISNNRGEALAKSRGFLHWALLKGIHYKKRRGSYFL
jgi:hypothetical protein